MKNLIIILLITLSYSLSAQWIKVNEDSTLSFTSHIYFFNKDTGLVSGGFSNAEGYFLKTTDGGNTWTMQDSIYGGIRTFQFVNDTMGYCGGTDGMFYRTFDGGVTWTLHNVVGDLSDYVNMHFFNKDTGIVFGGDIYKTYDGGDNWTKFNYSKMVLSNNGHFVDDSTGFISNWRGVFKTTDQGESWLEIVDGNFYNNYSGNSVYFVNRNRGFVSGYDGFLIETFDGGNSWGLKHFTNTSLNDIFFINDTIGFCGGRNNYINDIGKLYFTDDGGVNWHEIYTPIGIDNIYAYDSSALFITGRNARIFKLENPIDYIYNSTKSLNENFYIDIFPNPSENIVNFEINNLENELHKLQVFSIEGKLLNEAEFSSKFKLDMSEFKSGIYVYKISNKTHSKVGKLIKN